MARDPRLTAFRRTVPTRQAGWWLAAVLALLGIWLGAQRLSWHGLSRVVGQAGDAIAQAARLVLNAGSVLLLLAAAGLALGLALSGSQAQVARVETHSAH